MVVGPLLVLSWFFYRRAMPLLTGMLSHVVVDLLTHRTWAYNHLHPLPLPPIRSLVSYTDLWFTILEHAALLFFILWFFTRRRRPTHRGGRETAPVVGSE